MPVNVNILRDTILEALMAGNPDTVVREKDTGQLWVMIPEMGYPFEVYIACHADGSILDRSDEASLQYACFNDWLAQNS